MLLINILFLSKHIRSNEKSKIARCTFKVSLGKKKRRKNENIHNINITYLMDQIKIKVK